VIDVGTNSVRLLVADVTEAGLREVERDLVITRLGERVDRDRRLGPEPLRRTVAAIAGYAERASIAGAGPIRIIATSAVRDAANRAEFVAAVSRATDLGPEILSGEQEAALGFLGATIDLDADPPYLVVDIGGGSTELVRGTGSAERWISLDIGSVRLTERHIVSDPPTDREVAAVRDDAVRALTGAIESLGAASPGTLVGLAGTITTAAAIALGLTGYDRDAVHRSRLSRETVGRVLGDLIAMTSEQRRALPAMPRGREDVIVAGIVILEQVMGVWDVEEVLVSETDILDGAALAAFPAGDGDTR
jgi:exopolyphosphatase/guanosine-5'-triphosphate,3'-diphosphate pyrophosphatase